MPSYSKNIKEGAKRDRLIKAKKRAEKAVASLKKKRSARITAQIPGNPPAPKRKKSKLANTPDKS